MKKYLLVALIAIVSSTVMSQTINDVHIKDLDTKYIQLTAIQKGFSATKVTVKVDLGQEIKTFSSAKDMIIMDAEGNRLVFNTTVDALNFFDDNGYEFVTAYAVASGQSSVYRYLLKKKD